jgi:hypothetical protein
MEISTRPGKESRSKIGRIAAAFAFALVIGSFFVIGSVCVAPAHAAEYGGGGHGGGGHGGGGHGGGGHGGGGHGGGYRGGGYRGGGYRGDGYRGDGYDNYYAPGPGYYTEPEPDYYYGEPDYYRHRWRGWWPF